MELLDKNKYIALAAIIYVISYALFESFVWYGYDDSYYYSTAYFNVAPAVGDDMFQQRWGLIWLIRFMIQLLGINEFSARIIPVIATISIIYLIYRIYKSESAWIFSLALILLLSNRYFMLFSNKLYPELLVSFFMFLSIFIHWTVHKREAAINNNRMILNGIIFSTIVIYSFLIKLSSAFFLPTLFVLFILDLKSQKLKSFWYSAIGSALLITSIYFIYGHSIYGSWNFRMITNITSNCDDSYQFLYERWTTNLWQFSWATGYIIPYLIVLPALTKVRTSYWSVIALTALIAIHTFPINIYPYLPLCLANQGRQYLILIPFIAVASAPVLSSWILKGKYKNYFLLTGIVLVLGEYYFTQFQQAQSFVYILIGLIFISNWFRFTFHFIQKCIKPIWLMISFATAMLIHNTYGMFKSYPTEHANLKKIINTELVDKGDPVFVFADQGTLNIIEFLYKFDDNKLQVGIIKKDSLYRLSQVDRPNRLVQNENTTQKYPTYVFFHPYYLYDATGLVPSTIKSQIFATFPEMQLIRKEGNIELWKIDGIKKSTGIQSIK